MAEEKLYSFQTGSYSKFSTVDYVLFGLILAVSTAIGIYYAIKDRRRNNTKTFLMAGGNMNPIPVALSLLASFMSAITLLGTPGEMYNYTTMYWWIGLSYFFVAFGAAHVFMPIFYNLHVTSAYEVCSLKLRPQDSCKHCSLVNFIILTSVTNLSSICFTFFFVISLK